MREAEWGGSGASKTKYWERTKACAVVVKRDLEANVGETEVQPNSSGGCSWSARRIGEERDSNLRYF